MTEQGCLQAAFTEDTFSPFQENFELPFSQHGLLIESREALENGLAQIVYLDGDDQAAEKTQFLQSEPVQAFINNIYPVARE